MSMVAVPVIDFCHPFMHRQDIPQVRKSVNNERKLEHVDGAQLKANVL